MKTMTNRERVQRAVQCEPVDRIPWVPFSGCHSGALIGATATEILRDEDLLVHGATAAVAACPKQAPLTTEPETEVFHEWKQYN